MYVCRRLIFRTEGSNPAEGMYIRLLWMCIVYVEASETKCSFDQKSTTGRAQARFGLQQHNKIKIQFLWSISIGIYVLLPRFKQANTFILKFLKCKYISKNIPMCIKIKSHLSYPSLSPYIISIYNISLKWFTLVSPASFCLPRR